MFRLICTLILSLVFSQPLFATSTIITTSHFEDVKNLLNKDKSPTHSLLALDDDDTLTMMPCPSANHCQYLGGAAWYNWQAALPANSPYRIWKNTAQLIAINTLIFNMSNMVLTDPAIPSTLKTADQLGVSILMVTSRGYRMSYPTEAQLTQNGLLPLIEKNAIKTPSNHISFPGFYFPTPWNNKSVRRIAYIHGALYTSGQNKGELLKQFLENTGANQKIQHIIFVDDTYQNDVDVANTYKNNPNVDVTCVYFTRLNAHKKAFLSGKHAKALQALANQQWLTIRNTLSKNLVGFNL